jgi:molybdate transport system ATP-binding protein
MKITAVLGDNGSGKTRYIDRLRKQLATDKVRYIAFTDSYGVNVDGQYYLQLRWNQHDIDHETPTVGELLQRAYLLAGSDTAERQQMRRKLYGMFHLDSMLDKYIITLSSGELRKFQLTKTLFAAPKLLIMDNPFIGLDAETRDQLKELMLTMATEQDIELMLVLSKTDDTPDFVTDVVRFAEKDVPPHALSEDKRRAILQLPYHDNDYDCQRVIDMKKVTIKYGTRTILNNIDWTVMNGERWALTGQNGSGKSTLLSLVCADNPQSYACDITLFDRPRGSGESIWDIKKHIGYVSPEMHRSYKHNLPAIRIVASGLMDSIGLYAVPNGDDYARCCWWLDIFGIGQLADRPFLQLSSGEQRLVLLARAFVKDPQLLILDEPLHGLDLYNRRLVKDVIETFCQRRNKTMIMVTHYETELPDVITHQKVLARNL